MQRRWAGAVFGGVLLLVLLRAQQPSTETWNPKRSTGHCTRTTLATEPSSDDPRAPRASGLPGQSEDDVAQHEQEEEGETPLHTFEPPSGKPPSLSCAAARTVVQQARRQLAYEPPAVSPQKLAEATADWLDPHGLWSAAPDAPVLALLRRRARELVTELEASDGPCSVALETGKVLSPWIHVLRTSWEKSERGGSRKVLQTLTDAIFESGTITQPARPLAARIGERVAAARTVFGQEVEPYATQAKERYLPELTPETWSGLLLAAAVRAYVPLLDPHGAWAPADEEASIYEVDLEAAPPPKLWERATRTALGVRVDEPLVEPLRPGDVLVELGSVVTTGLPIEQVEQLALAVADGRATADAVVLTTSPVALRRVRLEVARSPDDVLEGVEERPEMSVQRVAYGDGEVIVVTITDVHDDLGESLAELLARERRQGRVGGIVLDLRSNGGGSTDGAIGALGIFLPGASLFPMKRRDGSMETDRAPDVDESMRWGGPVATLVDGDTASAAEMVAGALASYRRGPILGTRTFGKGCAQEYMDDEAGAGVLRLTTLLYALPDGTAVQQKGLTPTLFFPFPRTSPGKEREADLPNAPPPWTGPDMRDKTSMPEPGVWTAPWPPHDGRVGPCASADVCRALRMLAAPSSQTRTRHVRAKLH